MIEFLGRIDTGVYDSQRKETALTEEMLTLRQELFDLINRRTTIPIEFDTNNKQYTVELAHRTRGGKPAYLELGMESAGTLRLLMVLSLVYRALDDGTPVVIDELDASLHTLASEAVVQLFLLATDESEGGAAHRHDPRHQSAGFTDVAT